MESSHDVINSELLLSLPGSQYWPLSDLWSLMSWSVFDLQVVKFFKDWLTGLPVSSPWRKMTTIALKGWQGLFWLAVKTIWIIQLIKTGRFLSCLHDNSSRIPMQCGAQDLTGGILILHFNSTLVFAILRVHLMLFIDLFMSCVWADFRPTGSKELRFLERQIFLFYSDRIIIVTFVVKVGNWHLIFILFCF